MCARFLQVPNFYLLRLGLPLSRQPRGIDPAIERRPEAAGRPSPRGWMNRRRHGANVLAAVLSGMLWIAPPAKAQVPFTLRYDGTVDGTGLPDQLSAPGSSTFGNPKGLALDLSGNLYIADTGNNRILRVAAGETTAALFAISGLSSPSTLSSPNQLTVDSAGNLYIADSGNNRIVEVSPSGSASVLSTGSYTLNDPTGIAVDILGDVFISDTGHNRVIELPSGGSAAVLATTGIALTGLISPMGLATDTYNNLYIVDNGNNRAIKVDTSLHGSLVPVSDNPNGVSGLTGPVSVAVAANGIIYITDPGGFRVAVSDPQANTYDLFGDDFVGMWGTTFGAGVNAIATDSKGTIYVSDTRAYNTVWVHHQFSADFGHVTSGSSGTALTLNFTLAPGAFVIEPVTTVTGVAIYTAGTQNLDFTITNGGDGCTGANGFYNLSCTVRVQFTPTAAGLRRGALVLSYTSDTLPSGTFTVPLFGIGDGPVAALSQGVASQLSTGTLAFPQTFVPFQTAYDGAGNIYATDSANNRVLKIPAGGGNAAVVSTSPLTLNDPTGIAIDGAGNLYVSDSGNNRIVQLTASGSSNVVTLNASGISFNNPQSLFMDSAGNLFVNDVGNNRTVELTPAYGLTNDNTLDNAGPFVMSTGSLSPGTGGSFPYNVSTSSAVDTSGALYIADDVNNRVIKVDRFGKASPVDFSSLSQALVTPHSITLDPMGNLYVMDNGGGAGKERIIQQFTTGTNSEMAFSGTSFGFVSNQIAVDNYGNVLVADLPDDGGRLAQINVGESAMSFPSTPMNSASSALTTTVMNLGDLPLTFPANPTYTPNFSWNAADTNACTTATSLTVGASCDVSVVFTPQSTGSLSANIAVHDNTQNVGGSTQIIAVSGTATAAISTPPPPLPVYNPPTATSSISLTSSASSVAVGQSVTVTAVLTATGNPAGSASPSGTVQFLDGSASLGSVTLTGGRAVLTTSTLSAGTHRITAVYSGDATFLSNQASLAVTVTATTTTPPPATSTITPQNAAGNAVTNFAANEITSLYGITGLTGDMTATNPSTSLGGVTVTITDSAGTARQALLFGVYASVKQINLLIPSGMAPGAATVSVALPGGGATSATVNIAGTAAGIFTASANGQGVYAGQVIYQHSDGSQTIASPADPISLSGGNQVFLALYATGLRGASAVTATANGVAVPVAWFGPQGGDNAYGLDQVNLGPLPASLAGAGTVQLVVSVDGQAANTVAFSVQ